MKFKKLVFPIFIVVALIQLYAPASMIWNKEKILEQGKVYKFKTRPIDPTDPFRGKYITLQFVERFATPDTSLTWERGESVYVLLAENEGGFATVAGVSKDEPNSNVDFVKAEVRYTRNYTDEGSLVIKYPFERYYMEESKAQTAEHVVRRRRRMDSDSTQVVYALVRIMDGDAVLKVVMVNDRPIEDVVKEELQKDSGVNGN